MTKTLEFKPVYESVINSFRDMDNQKESQLDNIKEKLKLDHDISPSTVVSLLTREVDEVIETEDIRLPRLFVKEVLEVSDQVELIDELFTSSEVKELEQYLYSDSDKNIELPLELFPALRLNEVTHSVKMSSKMVAQLFESQILNYNFDIQREAQTIKRQDSIIQTPRINQKNVNEMRDLLLKEQLKDSTIYFNAAPRTSEQGDELLFDEKNHKLIITKGTRLDILDGFHRCLASQAAHIINPQLKFNFNVVISNYTTKEAQLWQAQHAKAMPWSQHRVKELQQENRNDKVVSALRSTPEVGEAIGTATRLHAGQIANFSTLSDAIDKNFKIETRRDEVDVAEFLTKYLDELIQYEIDWSTPRKDNMLTSTMGIHGIIYYLAKQKGEMNFNINQFYEFLDKYRTMSAKLQKIEKVDNLNVATISKERSKRICALVDEVIRDV